MDALDPDFRLPSVVAEFALAAHGPLRLEQGCFVPFKAVDRCVERAVREGGEAGNAHIDADCSTVGSRLRDLTFGLDRYEPLTYFGARL